MRWLVPLSFTALSLASNACSGLSSNSRSEPVIEPDGGTPPSTEGPRAPIDPTTISGYSSGDPTLPHVRGQGWYCYDAHFSGVVRSFCHRKEHCDAARDEVNAEDNVTATECSLHEGKATCLLATLVGQGYQRWLCTRTSQECNRVRMENLAARELYLFVSRCETID